MTNNHDTARHLVYASRADDDTPHPDARDVLEAIGAVEPGGRTLLPDDERRLSLGAFRAPAAAMLARFREAEET